jgi:hypothetical protein
MTGMTDREALEGLLRRFGLTPYTGQALDGQPDDDTAVRPDVREPDENEIILVTKVGGVEGYSNFNARFGFDAEGNFQSLGIWE